MLWKSMNNGYSLSEYGDVRNDGTNRILKPYLHHKGYLKIHMPGIHTSIHRLVGKYYVSNPYNKPQINHLDGNKLNNHYTNLEWATDKENNDHALALGLRTIVMGENHLKSKLTSIQVSEIRNSLLTPKEIATLYNTPIITIYKIRQGINRLTG